MTWQFAATLGNYDIVTAAYDAQGQRVAAPVNVSNNNAANEGVVQAAALSTGGYALTWEVLGVT